MRSLYISKQGCKLTLRQETVLVQQHNNVLDSIQLPLLEQIMIFGQSQVTTSVLQSCLQRQIPLAYLSQQGRCYGRLMPVEHQAGSLIQAQHALTTAQTLAIAQSLVQAKLKNSRVLLQRQRRRLQNDQIDRPINQLEALATAVPTATTLEQIFGLEGAGAAIYFPALGQCLTNPDFTFTERSRRPPKNPVNALLSFGYQVLWNHLLLAIELKGLDAYRACLHQPSAKHPALTSDLIEQFRAPIVDSLVLYLVNHHVVKADEDFKWQGSACYLNESGRRKYLQSFLQRMHETVMIDGSEQPRWALLNQQVKAFIQCLQRPESPYQAYLIR
ncbi:MAG: CRISPR-associated endonuclease Cas1 [Leptolyngbyaceae cyanobacterium T60_A2020_046]|nr:CRISPR-associated endonuclease Cas1 [Leptolyngbyaceae cyanobacterium T60_A2020_046]